MEQAYAAFQRASADLGGNSLEDRVAMEVLRLRGEGQFEFADQVAAAHIAHMVSGAAPVGSAARQSPSFLKRLEHESDRARSEGREGVARALDQIAKEN